MPFTGIFPFTEFLKSPLAKSLTYGGNVYKCVMIQNNVTDEFGAENYQLYAEVAKATAALIAVGATVVISGTTYYVTDKEDTQYGSTKMHLSLANPGI